MGGLLHAAGQIPVQRESEHAGSALAAAVDAVRRGECVVIYPEGTLTRDADLWPMLGKTGAARVWWQTRCPVIPVAQWGPQELLAPYGRVPRVWRRPLIRVLAGPAAGAVRPTDPPDFRALTASIMTPSASLLADLRHDGAPTSLFDPRASDLPRTGNPRKNQRAAPVATRCDRARHRPGRRGDVGRREAVMQAAVMGLGSWGTAFGLVLADAGHQVHLWGRNPTTVAAVNSSRRNARFHPDLELPASVTAFD